MTQMFAVDYASGSYSGLCFDGPLEGQWKTNNSSMFRSPIIRPAEIYRGRDFCISDNLSATVNFAYYRWSDPLKAWVCLNMR